MILEFLDSINSEHILKSTSDNIVMLTTEVFCRLLEYIAHAFKSDLNQVSAFVTFHQCCDECAHHTF